MNGYRYVFCELERTSLLEIEAMPGKTAVELAAQLNEVTNASYRLIDFGNDAKVSKAVDEELLTRVTQLVADKLQAVLEINDGPTTH